MFTARTLLGEGAIITAIHTGKTNCNNGRATNRFDIIFISPIIS